jgi:uncharacterized protein YndB with AHSA1/START domain
MSTIHKTVEIRAPVAQVFSYVSQPSHLPEIWPNLIAVDHVEEKPDGGHRFGWVYKMAGLRLRGHSETIAIEPNHLIVDKSDQGLPSTFRWTYEPKDGSTQVTLDVEYQAPFRMAEPILRRINERDADQLLANLKQRMEAKA